MPLSDLLDVAGAFACLFARDANVRRATLWHNVGTFRCYFENDMTLILRRHASTFLINRRPRVSQIARHPNKLRTAFLRVLSTRLYELYVALSFHPPISIASASGTPWSCIVVANPRRSECGE